MVIPADLANMDSSEKDLVRLLLQQYIMFVWYLPMQYCSTYIIIIVHFSWLIVITLSSLTSLLV